jgi:folate-binding protein YgfZ
VTPIGLEVFDVLRIEAGIPVYGRELREDYNPLEANLRKFVSFTKGCYIGQEVIVRLDTYNKLQRRLVGFIFDTRGGVERNARVLFNDEEIGLVTSSAFSYGIQKTIGLGYVKLQYAVPGVNLKVISKGKEIFAEVINLPFSI